METRTSPNDPSHTSASLIEVVAINIAWLCGLSGFAAGLVTQRNGLALQGLALFFATFFYTLVRAYHFRRTSYALFMWTSGSPTQTRGRTISRSQ